MIYDDALRRKGPGDLFRNLPVAYVWDDHDFLGNNSKGADPARQRASSLARDAYGIYTPHYALTNPTDGIYQAFEIGRTLFLLTDTRSQKSPRSGSGTSAKTMLGINQKSQLMNQLFYGKVVVLPSGGLRCRTRSCTCTVPNENP